MKNRTKRTMILNTDEVAPQEPFIEVPAAVVVEEVEEVEEELPVAEEEVEEAPKKKGWF
jgi:hypothetical protein